jgi:hypothetical protein
MTVQANIVPTAGSDGIPYCTSVPITGTEADLGDNAKTPSPIATEFGQAIVAVVQLTVNGIIVGSNAYVVMQQDMGDGVWADLAWAVWTGGQGTATFILCGGGLGAMNNAFQQTRQSGQFPSSSSSNAMPLGGRVRFVGKATAVGGSSSVSGTTAGITATIKFKLMAPR